MGGCSNSKQESNFSNPNEIQTLEDVTPDPRVIVIEKSNVPANGATKEVKGDNDKDKDKGRKSPKKESSKRRSTVKDKDRDKSKIKGEGEDDEERVRDKEKEKDRKRAKAERKEEKEREKSSNSLKREKSDKDEERQRKKAEKRSDISSKSMESSQSAQSPVPSVKRRTSKTERKEKSMKSEKSERSKEKSERKEKETKEERRERREREKREKAVLIGDEESNDKRSGKSDAPPPSPKRDSDDIKNMESEKDSTPSNVATTAAGVVSAVAPTTTEVSSASIPEPIKTQKETPQQETPQQEKPSKDNSLTDNPDKEVVTAVELTAASPIPPVPPTKMLKLEPKTDDRVFNDTFTVGDILGEGAFSVVRLATHKGTGEKSAVKCIAKKNLPKDDEAALKQEVTILRKLDHPNVLKCHGFFDEPEYYYLVMEYLVGGELFDRIVRKTFYSEREARDLVQILISTIHYLHSQNVVHRDLKPENLLMTTMDDDANVKLADFGFAISTGGFSSLKTQCGTPGYVAPEILSSQPYGKAVDMWSIGVITYILLGGYPPFHDDNQKVLFQKIKTGDFEFHPEYWDAVSSEAKDLIRKLLRVNPLERFTAEEALYHSWITRDAETLGARGLDSNLKQFKKFYATRKFKAAAKAIIAAKRMEKIIGGLTNARQAIEEEAEED